MNIYVWQRIERCTSNWHSEGGVVVFADSEARARELAAGQEATIAPHEKPDDVREVSGGVEAVYLMPDAGCC